MKRIMIQNNALPHDLVRVSVSNSSSSFARAGKDVASIASAARDAPR